MRRLLKLISVLTGPQRAALAQWWRGGLWIHHSDRGWVRGRWNDRVKRQCDGCKRPLPPDWIIDDTGHHYHRTLCTITEIRDFT